MRYHPVLSRDSALPAHTLCTGPPWAVLPCPAWAHTRPYTATLMLSRCQDSPVHSLSMRSGADLLCSCPLWRHLTRRWSFFAEALQPSAGHKASHIVRQELHSHILWVSGMWTERQKFKVWSPRPCQSPRSEQRTSKEKRARRQPALLMLPRAADHRVMLPPQVQSLGANNKTIIGMSAVTICLARC